MELTKEHTLSVGILNAYENRTLVAGVLGMKSLILYTWIYEGFVTNQFEVYGPTSFTTEPKPVFTSRVAKEALEYYNSYKS